jgi:hypothetical protein
MFIPPPSPPTTVAIAEPLKQARREFTGTKAAIRDAHTIAQPGKGSSRPVFGQQFDEQIEGMGRCQQCQEIDPE